ncbi:MAG: GNAT family N-acetyltransferase [Bacteroidales bacterium]|nr:GNAT family N-acetyltransferase [Bacteroidales bacterium]
MIRYLIHNEIDRQKWDYTIKHSFNGNVYALSWYLDLIHEDWGALVENDYERVMPLTGGKKWGIGYLLQPFFAQQLGVFSTSILTGEHVLNFIKSIPRKFAFVQMNLNIHNHPDMDTQYRLIQNKNHLLDLIHDYRKLSGHYSKNTKRNLKNSLKNDLSLSKNLNPTQVIELFRDNKGKDIKHLKDPEYQKLQRLMYAAIHKGKGVTYGIYTPNNELCAAAFFLLANQHLIFLFSGSNENARENGAMTFLFDKVINEFAGTQIVLDFEGSNDENLARFYKGFGAKEVHYNVLKYNLLPFPLKQMTDFWFGHFK